MRLRKPALPGEGQSLVSSAHVSCMLQADAERKKAEESLRPAPPPDTVLPKTPE